MKQDHIGFIIAAMRSETSALGFVPRAAIEDHVCNGRVMFCYDADQMLVSYLWHSVLTKGSARVFQLYTRPDARQMHFATLLLAQFMAKCNAYNVEFVSVRVRSDLAVLEFWQKQCFEVCEVLPARSNRGHAVKVLRLFL